MRTLRIYIKYLFMILLILNITLFSSCAENKQLDVENKPIDLGIPTKKYYPSNNIARCVWDMKIFNNKLYIGCGDYNNNSGPTPVLYTSLDDIGNWHEEGVLPDEQIGRFCIINGKLTIPGFDPMGTPHLGTYYQLEDVTWKTYCGILDGQHNFDLVSFDGQLFAGIGAKRGLTPIIATYDNKNFVRIPMYKNGQYITTTGGECIRTYNFYVIDNKLYAGFWYENIEQNKLVSEIYRYDNGVFVFECDLVKQLNMGLSCQNIAPEWSKEIINDRLFLTTGYLYYTDDMNDFRIVGFPQYARTYDLYLYENAIYVLTAAIEGKEYDIVIYSMEQGNIDKLKKEYSFKSLLHPTSFAVNDSDFFVALGEWNDNQNSENGTIFRIKRSYL